MKKFNIHIDYNNLTPGSGSTQEGEKTKFFYFDKTNVSYYDNLDPDSLGDEHFPDYFLSRRVKERLGIWHPEFITAEHLRELNPETRIADVLVALVNGEYESSIIGSNAPICREVLFAFLSDILEIDYMEVLVLWKLQECSDGILEILEISKVIKSINQ